MPVVSSYREKRLWHKGEIAEKGKRKEEKKINIQTIYWIGVEAYLQASVQKEDLRATATNLLIKEAKHKGLHAPFLYSDICEM